VRNVRRALFAVVLAALTAAAAAGAGTRGAEACKPGIRTIGTTTYRVFCGPASATVKVAGKKHSFRKGSCLTVGGRVFTLSIGSLKMTKGKARYGYLGVTVPNAKRDGVYRVAAVSFAYGGKRYSLSTVKVRLAGKRTRGTFSGRIVGKGGKVTGSFRCK
jgi:hypothetical protein